MKNSGEYHIISRRSDRVPFFRSGTMGRLAFDSNRDAVSTDTGLDVVFDLYPYVFCFIWRDDGYQVAYIHESIIVA